MLPKRALTLLLSLVLTTACHKPETFTAGKWIDLSHDFSSKTIYWPTAEPFVLKTVSAGMTKKGYYYSAYQFCAAEHGGTHIDAPIHFAKGHRTVDEIPLTQLIGPAIKIDVSDKVAANRDYQISVDDVTVWESSHGQIPDGSIVLLQTGYGHYWPNKVKYLGTEKRGLEGVAALHFPGLDPASAQWLVNKRKISAVGIDTASIDYGQSKLFGSHVALLGNDIPVFENVASLDNVPTTGTQIIAMPMKIKGGSGSPLRIVAFVPDK